MIDRKLSCRFTVSLTYADMNILFHWICSSGSQTPLCGSSTWGWQSSQSMGLSLWPWSRSYTTLTTSRKDWTTTLHWWNWPRHLFSMVRTFHKTLLSPCSLSHPAPFIHSFIHSSQLSRPTLVHLSCFNIRPRSSLKVRSLVAGTRLAIHITSPCSSGAAVVLWLYWAASRSVCKQAFRSKIALR